MDLKAVLRVLVLLPGLSLSTAALAQSAQQVLDTIVTFGAKTVYEMDLKDAPATGVELDALVTSDLKDCKLTANRGLFCIDAAKNVVNWKNPDSAEPGDTLFNCGRVSDFDDKSAETCTAITLDPAGNIWLAGKNKGKTHSLVKFVLKTEDEPCTGGSVTGTNGTYCTTLWATGRPLLLDIEYIGGEAADAFTYGDGMAVPKRDLGEGILGLQERKTVVFFPTGETYHPVLTPSQITEISSGKTGWGLIGNEQLQGVTLLQPGTTDEDFVLVTTSGGRIVAMSTANLLPQSMEQRLETCGSRSTQFGIRASAKTGRVYTTSKSCAEFNFTAYEPIVVGGEISLDVSAVVTLDTPPEGPTIAPGIGVDLKDPACKTGCPITVGATLRIGDALASDESGLIVFQVTNIPDCRWTTTAPGCAGKSVIVPQIGVRDVPATQYLNVTPLLPSEVTDLFPGGLPDLLISPQYRGQDQNKCSPEAVEDGVCEPNRVFEAFFYVPEEGVRFNGTFEAVYKEDTSGESLGCDSPDLLKWDVATRVSEKFGSVGGPPGSDHVDTLINTGCGSIITKKPGFSLVPYNLEITPDTYYGTPDVVPNNDAVFLRLLQKLHDDFRKVLTTRACYQNVDTDNAGDNPPLADEFCDALVAAYDDSKLKLDRCFEATYQPKNSAGAQNCQSFESQFKKFTDLLAFAVPNGPDPANRIGELQGRVAVIEHVYATRFLPSVPTGGFCEANCP